MTALHNRILRFFCAVFSAGAFCLPAQAAGMAEDPESLFMIGAGYHDHFILAGALNYYSRALEADPGYAEAYAARAKAFAQAGWFDSALADIDAAMAGGDRSREVLIMRGRVLHAMGEYAKALELLEALSAKFSRDADLLLYLGEVYVDSGRLEEAAAAFSRAIELDPYMKAAYERRAAVYAAMGKPGEAGRDTERAIFLNPKHPEAYRQRAEVLAIEGDFSGALHAMRAAWQLKPGDARMMQEIATLHRRAGNADAAADWLLQRLAHEKSGLARAKLWRDLAIAFSDAQRLEAGLAAYDRALQLEPDSEQLLRERLGLLQRASAWREVEGEAARLLTLKPRDAALYHLRAVALMQQDRWREALLDLDKAVKHGAADAQVFANRAAVRQRLEDYPGMLRDLDRAIPLASEALSAELRQSRQAVKDYLDALEAQRLWQEQQEAAAQPGS